MRIVTLIENTSLDERLLCEHGLSFYIEACGKKILFDFGQSPAFGKNAEKLGIDLSEIDFAVLSHGHYDHGGGIAAFTERNNKAPIYVSPYAFDLNFNALDRYIGLETDIRDYPQLKFVADTLELAPGIVLHSCLNRTLQRPIEPWGLKTERAGLRMAEDFRHEQYLLIEEDGKRICISGCSHRGIENIVHWFAPDVLVGGFHFMKIEQDSPLLETAAKELLRYPTVYYTGHCTGLPQYGRLKTVMGDRLHRIYTGFDIVI